MSLRRVIIGVIAGLIAVLVFLLLTRPSEPEFQGTSLSLWLAQLDGYDCGFEPPDLKAAFEAMPTNCASALVEMLRVPRRSWRTTLAEYLDGLPLPGAGFSHSDLADSRALAGFCAMGPSARSAIPELVPLLNEPETTRNAALALVSIGQESVLELVGAMTNKHSEVRMSVADALGILRDPRKAVEDALFEALADDDRGVRCTAAFSLAQLRPDITRLVEKLLGWFQIPDDILHECAAVALGSLGPPARAAVPQLERSLNSTSFRVRMAATNALGSIDSRAAQ